MYIQYMSGYMYFITVPFIIPGVYCACINIVPSITVFSFLR